MITVTKAYMRVLEEVDKIGSDYFSLPQVLSALQKEVWNFVDSRCKEIEITQEVTDDIRSLVIPNKIDLMPNPDEPGEYMAALPNNYHRLLKLNIVFSDNIIARKPRVERFGEHNTNIANPYKTPTRAYPLIQQFSNYFNVITNLPVGGIITPTQMTIIYVKKPTFGTQQSQPVVDLPDAVCEHLFAKTAEALLFNTGDPRGPVDFQVNKTYRDN